MALFITNATVTLQTATENTVAAGQTDFDDAAASVPAYIQPMTPEKAFQAWGVELNRPFLILLEGTAQAANVEEGGRVVSGSVKYRIARFLVYNAEGGSGASDHIEILADREQFS